MIQYFDPAPFQLLRKPFSGQHIVQQNKQPVAQLPRDLKKKFPTNSEDEQAAIQLLYANLYAQLKPQRIERTVGRARATVTDDGRIEVEKVSGKWNALGYSVNKRSYLHYHEALHLIEMNRLELKWNSVIVSVEQGYAVLLDTTNPNNSRIGIEEYVVYAQLQRHGFTVRLHSMANDLNLNGCWSEASRPSPADNCVWKCLAKMLQKSQVDEDRETVVSTDYVNTTAMMRRHAERIKLQMPAVASSSTDSFDWNEIVAGKRTADTDVELPPTKKCKRDTNEYRPHHYLDILLADVNETFEKIFHEINVIDLKAIGVVDGSDELRFVFDLYAPNSEFKKTEPTPPKYRIIVVK